MSLNVPRALAWLPVPARAIVARGVQHNIAGAPRNNAAITCPSICIHTPRKSPSRGFSSATDNDKKAFDEYINDLSPARKKFLNLLNEYKKNNFEHTTPNRFFKMLVDAVDSDQDGNISMSELRTLLRNIGVSSDNFTEQDMQEIFAELGVENSDAEEQVITVEGINDRWKPFLRVMWKKN